MMQLDRFIHENSLYILEDAMSKALPGEYFQLKSSIDAYGLNHVFDDTLEDHLIELFKSNF